MNILKRILLPKRKKSFDNLNELIQLIYLKHTDSGITFYEPSTKMEIINFEKAIGFALPDDFKIFYSI